MSATLCYKPTLKGVMRWLEVLLAFLLCLAGDFRSCKYQTLTKIDALCTKAPALRRPTGPTSVHGYRPAVRDLQPLNTCHANFETEPAIKGDVPNATKKL